ncbi:MAG: hypothetical protein Q7K25_03075 [Actinomycetota bacterium]|nr:hypothetical protein [Actinomycetota bacterium]
MTQTTLNAESSSGLSLSAFPAVWAFELADIDDRLSGNDPDSFANWLGGHSKKIANKTGVDGNDQIGLIGMIPGVRHVAMAGAAVGMGVDLFNSFDTIKKADRTQRLLTLSEKPEIVPNWDTVEMLIEHIDTWLLPVLNRRKEVLRQVNSASGGNQTVTDRIRLYEAGIAELNAAQIWLRGKEAEFKAAYKARELVYVEGANRAHRVYGEAKKAVNLSVDALLMDRTAGNQKVEEIERGYAALRCLQGGLLSQCENLRVEGGDFCLTHTCSSPGCSKSVAKSSHYCSDHGKQLQDVNAFMPKLLAKNGMLPKEKKPVATPPIRQPSPGASRQMDVADRIANAPKLITGILLGFGFLTAIVIVGSHPSSEKSTAESSAKVASAVTPNGKSSNDYSGRLSTQPSAIKSSSGIENFANFTAEQLESRRLEIEHDGELAGKKYDAYDQKVNALKPNLKQGDRDQVVANAKEIMATMESRLIELKAMKDSVEKLMQIYQFIEANPSKVSPGTTMANNAERLKNMQDAFQNIRQAVNDAESQNVSSRSALAEVIAAR